MNDILSPFTGTNDVTLEKKIDASAIKEIYLRYFNVDTSSVFKNTTEILQLKCNKSGYRFFFPLHISGDSNFYSEFGKFSWYYSDWKWEHEQCLKFIKPQMRVLEVGSGKGSFLSIIKNKLADLSVVGLELNASAIEASKTKNVQILNETIEQHAEKNPETYDLVCSFQVLEHIADVYSFINSKVKALKPEGKLVICVPNNDSFLQYLDNESSVLNMPPHHMGLWNKKSLNYLTELFSLELQEVLIEPLQESNFDNYQYVKVKKLFMNSSFLVKVYWKLHIHKLVRPFIKMNSKNITGHSIMVVFNKKRI